MIRTKSEKDNLPKISVRHVLFEKYSDKAKIEEVWLGMLSECKIIQYTTIPFSKVFINEFSLFEINSFTKRFDITLSGWSDFHFKTGCRINHYLLSKEAIIGFNLFKKILNLSDDYVLV